MSRDVSFNSAVSERAFDAFGGLVSLFGALVVASGGCAPGGGVALLEEQLERWRGATRGCEFARAGGHVGVGSVCSSCGSVGVSSGCLLGTDVGGVEGGARRGTASAVGEGASPVVCCDGVVDVGAAGGLVDGESNGVDVGEAGCVRQFCAESHAIGSVAGSSVQRGAESRCCDANGGGEGCSVSGYVCGVSRSDVDGGFTRGVPGRLGVCGGDSSGGVGGLVEVGIVGVGVASGRSGADSVSQARRKEKTKRKKFNRRLRKAQAVSESSVPVVDVVSEVDPVPEWRRKKLFTRSDFMRQGAVPRTAKARGEEGYFSACAPEVKQALRDSRAKMLIARNEADAAKYLNGINAADGALSRNSEVVDFLMEVKKVVGVVGGLKKSAKVAEVGGWVQTVINSALSDVSSRKPSSVPPLDLKSLGSSDGDSLDGGMRLVEGKDVVTLKGLGINEQVERLRLVTARFEEEAHQQYLDDFEERMVALRARGLPEASCLQPAQTGADVEMAVQVYYKDLARSRPLTGREVRLRDNTGYTDAESAAMAAATSMEEMDDLLVMMDG